MAVIQESGALAMPEALKRDAANLAVLRRWLARGGAKYASDICGCPLAEVRRSLAAAGRNLVAMARFFESTAKARFKEAKDGEAGE